MKKYIITAFAAIALSTSACVNLDLYPLSEGSSENWYSNEQEITLALNALYARAMWNNETTRLFNTDRFTLLLPNGPTTIRELHAPTLFYTV